MSIFQTLGLAYRGRKVLIGDPLINAIRNNKVYLVIIATNCGQATKKKISDKCNSFNVNYVVLGKKEELGQAIGKINISAIGISDEGWAKSIHKSISG